MKHSSIVSDVTVINKIEEELLNRIPSGVGIFEIVGDKSYLLYMNDKYYKMIGVPRQKRTAKTHAEFMNVIFQEDHEQTSATIERLKAGSDEARIRLRVLCGDGNYHWFRLDVSVFERNEDHLLLYCNYVDNEEIMNIRSELESANDTLKRQHEEEVIQRRLLEKNSDIFIVFNVTKNEIIEVRVNTDTFKKYSSGQSGEGIIPSIMDRVPTEEERERAADFFSCEKSIERFNAEIFENKIEYRSRQNDGCLHWLSAVCRTAKDKQTGDLVNYTFIRDVDTDKKRRLALESIIEEETDFVALVSTVTDIVTLLHFRAEYSALNKEDIFKVKAINSDEYLGGIMPEDRKALAIFFDKETLTNKLNTEGVVTETYRMCDKNGSWRRKKVRAFYSDDIKESITIIQRDITDLYREEQEKKRRLEKALESAESANRAKSEFLSNMSHEIRTPLNAIIGLTKLSIDSTKETETKDTLNTILESGHFLLSLINDILEMSRIESGKFVLNQKWISVDGVIKPCIDMLRPEMERKHIQFEYQDNGLGEGFEFYIDVLKTQQMIMNLLSNACKFTGEGGRIALTVVNESNDGATAVDIITVEDTGCGMTKEFMEQAFSPFAQEHNIYSETVQGTGLGLPLSREIAREIGGDILAESKIGVGSKFSIVYPYKYRTKKEPELSKETAGNDVKSKLAGRKILLCEDNKVNSIIAMRILQNAGCTVEISRNGKEGVDRFISSKNREFDAILMDIRMPVLSGIEAARCIRELSRPDAKTVPIVALSANAFEEDIRKSLDAGMNAHLAKPVDPDKIIRTLEELI